jgi:DNA polymerase III gamma/tau subunit
MNRIIEAEKLTISEDAKQHLLLISNCSIRNLINNLEKIYILSKPIDLQLCKQVCSNISFQLFEQYFTHLKKKELANAILVLYSIYDYGYSVIDILDYLFIFIKGTDLLSEDHKYRMVPKLCTAITLFHSLHEDVIELSFLTNQIYNILHE